MLHAGEHAFKYVQHSEKDVAGWLDGRGRLAFADGSVVQGVWEVKVLPD